MERFVVSMLLLGVGFFSGVIFMSQRFGKKESSTEPHPDFIALENAKEVMVAKIMSGKQYSSLDEILNDLSEEVAFQQIIVQNDIQE